MNLSDNLCPICCVYENYYSVILHGVFSVAKEAGSSSDRGRRQCMAEYSGRFAGRRTRESSNQLTEHQF